MIEPTEYLYVEKYRPQTIAECIIPSRLRKVFDMFVKTGDVPNMLLVGPPGSGKTTVALALCKEIGLNYLKMNASGSRGIDAVRTDIVNYASTHSFNGRKKVVILDEADGFTPEAQDALKSTVEEYSQNVSFILTCNFKSKLIEAIKSRCPEIDFNLRKPERADMAIALFKRTRQILDAEKVKYDPGVLVKIIDRYFPDYRRTLGELQKLSMYGAIDAGALSVMADIRNLDVLMQALKDKDFRAMRKWVVDNVDGESASIFRKLYDGIGDFVTPASVPQAITILNDHQYKAAFVADQELNVAACMTYLMADLEFK